MINVHERRQRKKHFQKGCEIITVPIFFLKIISKMQLFLKFINKESMKKRKR